jgi:hypothetical protein
MDWDSDLRKKIATDGMHLKLHDVPTATISSIIGGRWVNIALATCPSSPICHGFTIINNYLVQDRQRGVGLASWR